MTVQCPRCGTRYRVADDRVRQARPVFKCTGCGHLFSHVASARERAAQSKDENLSFDFEGRPQAETKGGGSRTAAAETRVASTHEETDEEVEQDEEQQQFEQQEEPQEDQEEQQGEQENEQEDEPAPPPPPPPAARASRRRRKSAPPPGDGPAFLDDPDGEDDLHFDDTRSARDEEEDLAAPRRKRERAAESTRPAPPPKRRARADEEMEDEDDLDTPDDPPLRFGTAAPRPPRRPPNAREADEEPPRRRSPLKPLGYTVATILAFYLFLAMTLNQRPETALDFLRRIPLLGRMVADDNLLVWRLQIVDLEGGVDHIKGYRPAYVVSGRAVNTTSDDLRIIEIEGRLMAGDEVVRSQRVYAANQFRNAIRELSGSEVEMLLRLEPSRQFAVRPGESAHFLLVFPDPPRDVTDVSCRIVQARRT